MQQVTVNYISEDGSRLFDIVPLKIHRNWMTKSQDKFAYKCLPLNIANQYGWAVLSPCDFKVSWYGGDVPNGVEVFDIEERFMENIHSHFGSATFTINVDFIIKTPENYSLYIRGLPNKEYGILKPLDAIVETDWLPFTFTYNFKFLDTGVYEFKKGDPLFSFFPILRNTVENFEIISQNINEDKKLLEDFSELAELRHSGLSKLSENGKYDYQKFYINGKGPSKVYEIKNHIKKLFFKDIIERD